MNWLRKALTFGRGDPRDPALETRLRDLRAQRDYWRDRASSAEAREKELVRRAGRGVGRRFVAKEPITLEPVDHAVRPQTYPKGTVIEAWRLRHARIQWRVVGYKAEYWISDAELSKCREDARHTAPASEDEEAVIETMRSLPMGLGEAEERLCRTALRAAAARHREEVERLRGGAAGRKHAAMGSNGACEEVEGGSPGAAG